MSSLFLCPECNRHVRRSEASCPFCGASVAEAMAAAPERALPTMRLSRAALYAFAAASVGTAACSSDMGNPVPMYGAPFPAGGNTGSSGAATSGGSTGSGATAAMGGNISVGGAGGAAGTADAGPDGAAQGGRFNALYGGPPKK